MIFICRFKVGGCEAFGKGRRAQNSLMECDARSIGIANQKNFVPIMHVDFSVGELLFLPQSPERRQMERI
jgi:hypothetical protein